MDFAFVVLKICRYFWYFSGEPPTCPMVFFRSDWAGFYLPRISRISWSDIHVLLGHVTSNLSMHSLIRDEDLRVPDWSSKQIDTCFYPNILRHNQNRIGEIWACAAVNHSKKKIKILYSQVSTRIGLVKMNAFLLEYWIFYLLDQWNSLSSNFTFLIQEYESEDSSGAKKTPKHLPSQMTMSDKELITLDHF